MASEGQYALSSHVNHSINKTLIFVKLTDSALNAIEDYLNNKGNVFLNSKPTIEFRSNDSQGVINLPIRPNNSEDESQRFSFTLSNVEGERPQGSYECLRQSKNKIMESFGSMHYKLQIHASEDSYQKTKVKMAVVEQESKKNCTKVIKASGPNVGRKVKVKRPFGSSKIAHNNHSAAYNKTGCSPTVKINGTNINGNSVNSINSIPTIKNNVSNSGAVNHNNMLATSSDNSKKSFRETVIHLLALKPYKKSELISRLSNDGFKDIDKKELSSLLNSISLLKDAAYHLNKNMWSEVHLDWQYFTNEERDMIRKRNLERNLLHPQIGISPLSDSSSLQAFSSPNNFLETNSPPISPANNKRSADNLSVVTKKQKKLNYFNNNNVKSPSNKLQTNGYHDVLNGWANKPSSPERNAINRVSQVSQVSQANCTTDLRDADSSQNNASHPSPDSNGICLPTMPYQQTQNNRINCNFITNDNYGKKKTRDAFNYKNAFHVSSTTNGLGSVNSSPNSSPDSGTGSHDGSILSSTNSYSCTNEDTTDYLSKYIKIVSNDQRAQYKKDFNREYEEYRRLHRYIENVALKFSELEIRLNTKIEGSDDWNKLMDQIVKEYEETKNSAKFQEARKRMFYLHDKLAHIKSLVIEYDRCSRYKDKNRLSHKIQMKSTQS